MFNSCTDFNCPNMGAYGCTLTACSKRIQHQTIPIANKSDAIIFPQTIGGITFYSSKELMHWVETQQKMNKDPNYGVGNWC